MATAMCRQFQTTRLQNISMFMQLSTAIIILAAMLHGMNTKQQVIRQYNIKITALESNKSNRIKNNRINQCH